MRRIVVTNNLTLDGVMQAPGRPDEDERGGFDRGGWGIAYNDQVKGQAMAGGMASTGALLLGRRTYEDFHSVWPRRLDNPFTGYLNQVRKYVASTTLRDPLPWENSTLLKGDAADAVEALKQDDGGDLTVMGSGLLVQSLRRRHLIDLYVLMIHPLIFGKGGMMFPPGCEAEELELVDSVTTTKGVIIATYKPA
jgi:dihydrofolate reductase